MLNNSDDAYADIDNDGAFDSAEVTTEVDTDNDGTPDFLDSDSDNDDCSDTKEAGYTDIEDDAKLGGSPIQVDSMGKVTTASDGYTTPKDGDNNEVYDYQEVGADPVLTANASDVTVTENTPAQFVVEVTSTNPVSYQWQISTDNGLNFTNLTADAMYSGIETNTLTITNASYDMDQYQYQALIYMETFACGTQFQTHQ